MKQEIRDYLTPSKPVDPQDYRALQRSALKEYFQLLPETADPVVQLIEQETQQQRQDIEERSAQESQVVHLCHDPELEKHDRDAQAQLKAIETQCQQERGRLQEKWEQKKLALENQTQIQNQQAQKRFDEQRMVAEFVAGGTEEKCQKQGRQLKDMRTLGKRHLAQLQEQAEICFERYHLSQDLPSEEPLPVTNGEHLENELKESQTQAEQDLEAILKSKLAPLLMGWRLWICLLGTLLCAEFLAVIIVLTTSTANALAMVCLATAAGVLGVGGPLLWLLQLTCRRRLQHHHLSFVEAFQKAEQGLNQYEQWKQEQLTQRLHDAKEILTQELNKAREEQDQSRSTIQKQYQESLEQLNNERHKSELQLQQRQAKALAQARQRHQERHDHIEQQRHQELAEIEQRRQRDLNALETRQQDQRQQLEQRWDQALATIKRLYEQTQQQAHRFFPPLNDMSPEQWNIPEASATMVGFGYFKLNLMTLHPQVVARGKPTLEQMPPEITLPALLGLPQQGSLLLQSERAGREQALETLRAVVARLFTAMVPGKVRFTLIDPVGLGETFAGFMHAGDYQEALVGGRIWTEQVHIQQQLEELTGHMETVIQKYLRNEFDTIEAYNEQAGELAEPYRFLVIADFPTQFNEECARRLTSILQSGPRCGVHTMIAYDARQNLAQGFDLEDLRKSSIHLLHEESGYVWQDPVYRRFALELERPLSEHKLTDLMHRVGQAGMQAARVEVPFNSIAPSTEQVWSLDSRHELTVAMGRTGATRRQHLALGKGMSQHMLIAGKTGSGKSTLFHVMITNLALWYSPHEVEMYLIDFKKGVEFKTYVTHQVPHIRAVAIESDREFGLSILQRLDAELTQRGEQFRQAGVQDIAAYRDQTGQSMPRTLLIVDEFQVFFGEDDKIAQDAAILLEQLVRQGRAFGVHVVLGSQTLGGAFGLARSTMGQMAIRLALQCSEADSQLILDDDNIAARNLSRPGEAIYNDAGGQISGNSPFQVAWLPDQVRDQYLAELPATPTDQPAEAMIVFEGSEPADIRENKTLMQWIQHRPETDISGAPVLWLGAPLAIKTPTSVTLRRQSGAHLLMVGQRDDMALHLISAAWLSLAAQQPSQQARFIVLDGSTSDSPLAGHLNEVAEWVSQETTLVPWRDVETALADLTAELHRRLNDEASSHPSIVLMIYGLQRYRMLRRHEDSFGFSLDNDDSAPASADANLAELLREGPAVGIHVITWADTLTTLERTFDRATLREFDHRVLMQMSANDSSNLIDSTAANQLGFHRALLYSEEQGGIEKFRPYALLDLEWLKAV